MNPETYDQVAVSESVVGDAAPYLQEGMAVQLSAHNGVPIALELPQRVTFEIVETEPVTEGPDGLVLLQARDPVERRAHHGAAAHRRRHPRRGHDRRRLLRRARQGLTPRRRPSQNQT